MEQRVIERCSEVKETNDYELRFVQTNGGGRGVETTTLNDDEHRESGLPKCN
jgi:hypothetical protein